VPALNAVSQFSFPQRLTHAEAMGVLSELNAALQGGVQRLDLSALTEFDSSALSVLLAARRAGRDGMRARCVNAPDKLRKLAILYGVEPLIFDEA
jgi:ABC-type transporter Mla MlaB component